MNGNTGPSIPLLVTVANWRNWWRIFATIASRELICQVPNTLTKTEADQTMIVLIERAFRKTADGDDVLEQLKRWLGAQGLVLTGGGVKRLRKGRR